jgi:hypothetical protein
MLHRLMSLPSDNKFKHTNMKKTILFAAFLLAALANFAQDTTTVIIKSSSDTSRNAASDTLTIGSMVIIKKGEFPGDKGNHVEWHHNHKNNRLQTSWLLLDLGYSNFTDKTDYTSQETLEYTGGVPFTGDDFTLRNGKSTSINVWIFRQRYGLTRDNAFNLTYGFVIETNNFRFENNPSFKKGGPPYVIHDTIDFDKNKLAASYFTVPVMIGFKTNPKSSNSFNMNAGVSIGYMYSSRNKQISDERGKQKIKGNFNMEPWKVQVIAEMGFNWIKLYGAYSPNSMFKSGLDFRPYSIGLRLGGWD